MGQRAGSRTSVDDTSSGGKNRGGSPVTNGLVNSPEFAGRRSGGESTGEHKIR